MTTELSVRVEDKLFYNRYLVDTGRAHIKVRPHTSPSPALLTLLKACPARCYELNDKGQVEGAIRAVATACCSSSVDRDAGRIAVNAGHE